MKLSFGYSQYNNKLAELFPLNLRFGIDVIWIRENQNCLQGKWTNLLYLYIRH